MTVTVRGGCAHDCPDSCAWVVTVDQGRAVHLAGDPDHPYTHGALCAKVNRYLDRVYSPDRVLHPLRRTGPKGEGRFERVAWEDALAGIAERLGAVIAEHGAEAVLPYSYAGNMGLVQYRGMDRRFFARMGASRLDRTICGDTANAGVRVALGTDSGMLPEDIEHSRLVLLWGTNTLVTNAHLWPYVRKAKERGATVVAIDPVRTRTAAAVDWHLAPLPGSDAALALGMMRVMVDEGLHDADYLERFCNGFDELRSRLHEYPLERCAQLTGLAGPDIARLARLYASKRPACIRTLVGAEKQPNGGRNFRTIACLPAVVGAWRERGGGLLHWTRSFFDECLDAAAVSRTDIRGPRSRKLSMIQVGRALTDPDLEPPVKALVVYDSNPAVIAPNQDLVLRGLAREDLFTVVSDLFLTDTARYADYVLPATSFLEHLDLLLPWGHTYVTLNRPAIEPLGESVSNGELFRRLATAMGYEEPHLRESDEAMVRAALATGHPYLEGISYEALLERGWAPLQLPVGLPFADGFPTASGRCELFAEPSPAHLPPPDGLPLTLVSAKTELHYLNSSYSQLPRHAAAAEAFAVHIHPDDAAVRSVADGDPVIVWSEFGSLELPASVGDRVRPGVVAIPHGRWGRSANVLTSDGLADLGGGGDFFGTRVDVRPAAKAPASGSKEAAGQPTPAR